MTLCMRWAAATAGVLWLVGGGHDAAAQSGRITGPRGTTAHGTGHGVLRDSGAATEKDKVRIRDIDGLSARSRIRTPTFSSSLPGPTKPPREWIQIAVTYDTYPAWIDELTFKYYVLSLGREDGKPVFSLFENTVTYVDIERGRGHVNTMYLRPPAVDRYGDVLAIAVEVIEGGNVVAQESVQPKDYAPDWWKKARENVKVRAGYLLNRAQTPFQMINPDDYEYVRP